MEQWTALKKRKHWALDVSHDALTLIVRCDDVQIDLYLRLHRQ